MVVLITTSRRPTKRINRLAKELSWVFPNSIKINRGKRSLKDLIDFMIKKGYTKLLIIEGRKGNPRNIKFFSLSYEGLIKYMTIELLGLSLQIDKGMNKKLKTLSIEDDGLPRSREIKECIVNFLGSEYLIDPRREGINGKMMIRSIEDLLLIEFYDIYGRDIYPKLRVGKCIVNIE
ncbi:MAG TPA: hypothetical protein EYH44_02320 [Thermoprotei archaeon]|nr:hypothetical protein [Thermoprotei archaeon]